MVILLPYCVIIFRFLLFWRADLVQRKVGQILIRVSLCDLSQNLVCIRSLGPMKAGAGKDSINDVSGQRASGI